MSKLTEALSLEDKVRMHDEGSRIINLGACSLEKLLNYYHIAYALGYKTALRDIEREMRKRKLGHLIFPDILASKRLSRIEIDYRGNLAKLLLLPTTDIDSLINLANKVGGQQFFIQYVLTFLAENANLRAPGLASDIRKELNKCKLFAAFIPDLLKWVMSDSGLLKAFTDELTNGVNQLTN